MKTIKRSLRVFLLSLIAAVAFNAQAQPFLDNYHVYVIQPNPVNQNVQLRGQFEQQFLPAFVVEHAKHLNPALVNNQQNLRDPNAHLSWYHINAPNEPNRVVTVQNQFGMQTLLIGNPKALLAPTEKIEPGSQFPQGLDHYKVYEVLQANPVNQQVNIRDQFVPNEGNVAMNPVFFAVPVEKWHNGNLFPINNTQDHIVFYDKDPINYNFFRNTQDQFGFKPMQTVFGELLGIVSAKLNWNQVD